MVQFWACLRVLCMGISPPKTPGADALQGRLRLCGAQKPLQQPPHAPGQMASSHQDMPGGTRGRFVNPLWFGGHQPGEGEAQPAAVGLPTGGIRSEPPAPVLYLLRLSCRGTDSTLQGPQEARIPISMCLGGKCCQVPEVCAFASVLIHSVLRALFCVFWELTICKDMLLG